MASRMVTVLVGLAFLAAVGCESTPPPAPKPPQTGIESGGVTGSAKEPVWVSQGGGAFPGDRGKFLYAVGSSAKDINRSLTETRARDRGRQELARIIETQVNSMIKDFMESHKDYADPKVASSIEFTQIVSKSVSAASVSGAVQQDSWAAPDGTLYVLMRLAVEDLIRQTEKAARDEA
ncbi:MAG: hypothetical protein FJ278_23760, partial [Planctomycetes bacterium]|nr:hypothetical protein [Planctomycetota bacterium]